MTRKEAQLHGAKVAKASPESAFRTGLEILRAGHAEILLPAARKLAERHRGNAQFQQLLGLCARAVGDTALAKKAFSRAAELAPSDPLILHSHARTVMEAGLPAVDLFEKALRAAPANGDIIRGIGAARLHQNSPRDALEFLESVVARNPLWIDGHRDIARIRKQLALDPLHTIEQTLSRHARSAELHYLAISTALEALDLAGAQKAIERARSVLGNQPDLMLMEAHTASEACSLDEADALYAKIDTTKTITAASYFARHLLRAGRPERAAQQLEPLIRLDAQHLLWPYLSLAWRMIDDERWRWLEGPEEMVGVYDLADKIKHFDELVRLLRSLHFAKAQPLDQSVRGGTQTDGNLLLRLEAPIRQLREVIIATVRQHVANLPAYRRGHPTLIADRDPLRVTGSWSVRLEGAGFHSDHIHSEGWISSALYLVVPDTVGAEGSRGHGDHAGWLALGQCRDVLPDLAPTRLIQPKPGRLVLFPSTMWHGTRAFPSGERMTVAFDIARPSQETE